MRFPLVANTNPAKKGGNRVDSSLKKFAPIFSKRKFLILAFLAFLGTGGVAAATSISVNSGSAISLGAGYAAATACDENVTLKAKTALDASTGQLYVAAFELSDISQNATTGCGNKTMEMALKINGQMTYASWDIPASGTDSTFNFSAATISISDYNAMTALTPFAADGLTNVAITKIGSFTGYDWSQVATSRDWTSITSSSDGTKLAAVVNGGYIYTSTDSGATWTQRTASGSRYWYSITSSSDGTKLAAVVDSGYIYTSTDSGATWTERSPVTASTTRTWYSITSSSDGTKLAAVVRDGYIYTSTDSGATWTERSPVTASTTRDWRSITSSSDGTKLAAVVHALWNANGYIYTSSDSGVTWTESTASGSRYWKCITSSSDGTKRAAVTYGYIYKSATLTRSSN